jgi:hypothetical protein
VAAPTYPAPDRQRADHARPDVYADLYLGHAHSDTDHDEAD